LVQGELPEIDEEQKDFLKIATDLSEDERQQITDMADSIAKKESNQSWRVLFQRAPASTLPFIIYCVYIGIWGGVTLFRLGNFTGEKLIIISILLGMVMILPLLVLPLNAWLNLGSYIKQKFTGFP
jgi:hypothetical protein